VFTREDGPHKPSPEPIWQMSRRWKLKHRELLMVGDYKWDVLCAQNAGIRSVVLLNGGPMPDWAREADYIVHRLSEVASIVKGGD